MPAHTSRSDTNVLFGHSAKRYKQLGIGCHDRPRGGAPDHIIDGPDDMGEDYLSDTDAIAVHRRDISADAIKKAMDLALRVVKATGACPAVGPSEDGLIAS